MNGSITIVTPPPEPELRPESVTYPFVTRRPVARVDAAEQHGSRLSFIVFLLATAALVVRVSDFVPALSGLPLYQFLMVLCLVTCLPECARELSRRRLAARPIGACVLGLLVAVVLSHLSSFRIYEARIGGFTFLKITIYFLLLITLVNSYDRLRQFLRCVAIGAAVLTIASLMHYHGLADFPALEAVEQVEPIADAEDATIVRRLCAGGIFNDPNDFSLILNVAVVICLYFATAPQPELRRLGWVALIALLGYALALTYSRGGLLAFLAGTVAFLAARLGWRRALLPGLIVLPVLLMLFGGRQTRVDIKSAADTFQTRLQRWSETIALFRQDPLLGAGEGRMPDLVGQVAHNSFLQAFGETGFVGGTLFLGSFAIAIWSLTRAVEPEPDTNANELLRLRPYVIAITVSYAVGLLSLSRNYVATTYLILGLAAAYLQFMPASQPAVTLRLGRRLAALSVIFLAMSYMFVRTFVRWG